MELPQVDIAVVLQIAIVFVWAMGMLLAVLFVKNVRAIGLASLVGTVVAALAGIPLWNANRSTFGGMLALDNYALTLNWIFLGITAITILISLDYLPRHGIEQGEYYVLLLFATGAMMLLGQGNDLIVLFLGLELLSITLYVLAGFAYPRLSSEEAAMKYLLVGAFAAGFLVFGIALVYGASGASNLTAINTFLAQQNGRTDDVSLLLVGAALVVVGFGYKIAMAPFHMWTPDVYEGSPTPVAAFMSVGAKSAGFAALTRFLVVALPAERAVWVPILAALAAVTMIVGNVSAVAQTNVKRMLAYSSVGHAGYILMGTLAGNSTGSRGVEAMLFYLVAYSLTNLAAFAVLITLEQRGESAWSLDSFAGLWERQPWLAVAMGICMFSLAGMPLTAGFVGKFYVFAAAWQAGLIWLTVVGVVTSAISAFFYLRIVVQMFMRSPAAGVRPVIDRGLDIGIAIATIGILVFGIIPTPIVDLVQNSIVALGQ
ncbi:MAG TPA: NADH-quinone oxidoreductase subunit N [Roseiflexaceae bacterium]|jgi:NADH-quinone oxidoreductase subunit N|nr:NADH-quinone oxidoreductase subunit N [Roseiflexaceae bacterium]